MTSGGTESCLLAVQGARDSRPDVDRPRMVVPSTVHAAFLKAAHYFGVEAVVVAVGADFRADPDAMVAAIDEAPERTVLVVVSAPSYAHGVIDPVPPVAAAAAARGIRCHVDGCIGGWVLPYAARLGRDVPPWTFAVEGVTSISVDTHKYAYAPKGTSVLLHRSPALRRPQYFAHAAWPGYTMLNSTLQSTKSGGPLAGAWAVVQSLGDAGYERLTRDVFEAVDRITAGIGAIAALSLLAVPDSTLIALVTDETCDAFTICDEMAARDWYVQPQMSYAGQQPNIHLSVSAGTLRTSTSSWARWPTRSRPRSPPGPSASTRASRRSSRRSTRRRSPTTTSTGCSAASGLVGGGEGLALPERMAEADSPTIHRRLWQELDLLCLRQPALARSGPTLYETFYATIAGSSPTASRAASSTYVDARGWWPRQLSPSATASAPGSIAPGPDLSFDEARTIAAQASARLVGHQGPLPRPTSRCRRRTA